MTANEHTARLEELRAVIRAESISYGELAELADLAPYIEPGDVELLQWAGVPEFTDERSAYDRAIAYAQDIGARNGRAAASWYFDGNTTDETYAAVLKGIEDGDPAILDTLPFADLSGQWADSLTGPQLIADALADAGISDDDGTDPHAYAAHADAIGSDICDAYELAFSDAVSDAIETAARAAVTA